MQKFMVFVGMTTGSLIGGYLPVIFGVSAFSYTSILTGAVGAIFGIWAAFKFNQYFDL